MVTILITIVGFVFALLALTPLVVATNTDSLTMNSPLPTHADSNKAPAVKRRQNPKQEMGATNGLQPVAGLS